MMKAITTSLLTAVLFVSAPAQEDTPSLDAKPDTATVYIYKTWHTWTLWRAAFAVYLDNKMIARLDRGIYCVAHIEPGVHQLSTKDKRAGGVEINFEVGKTYYIRMTTDSGAQVTHPRLDIPSPEEALFDLGQMSPITQKDIKDKNIVSVPKRYGKRLKVRPD